MKGGKKMKKSILDWVALILLIIGGLNWGLYALNPTYDLVAMLSVSWLVKTVYYLVALAALYTIYYLFKE
ncbi:MAG: DUF378 domain-containing protein [Candidatus Pacearchaeota archaeon]|jgi:hypothetical protein